MLIIKIVVLFFLDNYICHPNEWACPHSGRCIKLSQVCDGTNHCASGGDEGGQCGKLEVTGISYFILIYLLSTMHLTMDLFITP